MYIKEFIVWILYPIIGDLILRPIGWIIYPFIYPFRNKIRSSEIIKGTNEKYLKPNKYMLFLWIWLDDSIFIECGVDYKTSEGRGSKPKTDNKFLKFLYSYYWSAFRNSLVNGHYYFGAGMILKVIKNFIGDGNSKNYFTVYEYEKGNFIDMKFHFTINNNTYKIRSGFVRNGRFDGITFRKV